MTMKSDISDIAGKRPGPGASPIWPAALIAAWGAMILALSVRGAFDMPADQSNLPTLIAIVAPVMLFAAGMAVSPRLRQAALGLDPVLLIEFQAWRILGGVFLVAFAFGTLPGVFAWPAGLGDMAIGVAAPFVAWRLRRDADFLKAARFSLFHALGLLDLAVAVAIGTAARRQIGGLVDQVTTLPMGQMPLVLIPAFVVPAFIILHIISLMQTSGRR